MYGNEVPSFIMYVWDRFPVKGLSLLSLCAFDVWGNNYNRWIIYRHSDIRGNIHYISPVPDRITIPNAPTTNNALSLSLSVLKYSNPWPMIVAHILDHSILTGVELKVHFFPVYMRIRTWKLTRNRSFIVTGWSIILPLIDSFIV